MSRILATFGVIESGSFDQLNQCLSLEDTSRGVLCADNHVGYSMPIGGVIATQKIIIPAGVGYDIGCGNYAVRTNIKAADVDIPRVMDELVRVISFGVGRVNSERVTFDDYPVFERIARSPCVEQRAMLSLAQSQFGTVGSGNHYVDIFVEDATGDLWVGVHFGSRGFGHKTAEGFLSLGNGLPWSTRSPKNAPIVTFAQDSDLGQLYLKAMEIAGEYAHDARIYVVNRVLKILGARANFHVHNHHNYAWKETHFGDEYLVTRKGATPAAPGQLGFIGGSMGEHAVIVEGVDSDLSRQALYSTVHGAGRAMSRGNAKRSIVWSDVLADLKTKGIELRGADRDEAPGAYKRLSEVLTYHTGTINILHELRPLGVAMAGKVEDPYKD